MVRGQEEIVPKGRRVTREGRGGPGWVRSEKERGPQDFRHLV